MSSLLSLALTFAAAVNPQPFPCTTTLAVEAFIVREDQACWPKGYVVGGDCELLRRADIDRWISADVPRELYCLGSRGTSTLSFNDRMREYTKTCGYSTARRPSDRCALVLAFYWRTDPKAAVTLRRMKGADLEDSWNGKVVGALWINHQAMAYFLGPQQRSWTLRVRKATYTFVLHR